MGSVAYNNPIGKDYKWYISGIFPANWVIIYHQAHLFRGTRKKTTIDTDLPKSWHPGSRPPITGKNCTWTFQLKGNFYRGKMWNFVRVSSEKKVRVFWYLMFPLPRYLSWFQTKIGQIWKGEWPPSRFSGPIFYLELQTTRFFMVVSTGWFQIITLKNCCCHHPSM